MYILLLSSLILTADPNTPTEIIGSAAKPDGSRKEIIVEQPQNSPDPFGYVVPEERYETPPAANTAPDTSVAPTVPTEKASAPAADTATVPLVNQSAEVAPQDMNPRHYQNQIENTIYQSGDRLIDVQSIPLKDISAAVQPNTQPEITDYPAF